VELIIRNGFVFDPLNKVEGEKMDVFVKDGKIVEKVDECKAKVIDASGMMVLPGGVDLHCHIAGSEVNAGRLLRPEDHFKNFERKTRVTRSGSGHSVPSTFTTGYRYARMGYTTIMNPAMPPLEAKHTHDELNDTPMVDKGSYTLLTDWWFILECLENGKIEECVRYAAWILKATKGYAIKIVNPGGIEAWGFGRNVQSLDDPVPYFNVTPREIIRALCKVNNWLGLPHTIHLHTNNLGKPGNYITTLETMKCVEDLALKDKPVIHITHCQFSSFKGSNWRNLRSGAEEIARYVNNHSHVTLDMGQVIFTNTTTMTADAPFQFTLHQLTGNKWMNHDVETETSSGIVPFRYKRKNFVHAMQWSIGLELALLVDNPWKIFLTTDHPNAGPFTAYPRIISWLVSRKARESTFKKISLKAQRKSLLPSITRELTLYEITIMTRSGQAKVLGLKNKGHLGVGADADVAIYNLNPEAIDPSKDYKEVRKAFRNAVYTIKNGEIVVKNGEITKHVNGATLWVNLQTSEQKLFNEKLKEKFRDYWTVEYENYAVEENRLKISNPINVEAKI